MWRGRGKPRGRDAARHWPGGLGDPSYTVWLGPFGGHEMGLTHYLGGARAAARYTRKHCTPAEDDGIVVVRGIGC